MLARLKRIKFAADVAVLEMPPGIKDPNELHKWKKRDFPVAFQELLDTATPTGASAVAKAEILDAAPSTISRPLCIVQGHAYASTWLHIKEPDRDLLKRQLCIQRSDWRGHVTVPKGGPLRYVPMTSRLALALREHRHLKSPRVLCQDDGSPLTQDIVGKYVRKTGRQVLRLAALTGYGTRSVHTWR